MALVGELECHAVTSEAGAAPFRFQGHYSDSALNTYGMQARSYRPDIGRFLSQDRYEGASADVMLQSDPLTQNRYAFGSGNPVDNVESDGHDPHAIETGCRATKDPDCGDRVGLASAAQSGSVALSRAKRELRAFKPVQAKARSEEASAKAGQTVPHKTSWMATTTSSTPTRAPRPRDVSRTPRRARASGARHAVASLRPAVLSCEEPTTLMPTMPAG